MARLNVVARGILCAALLAAPPAAAFESPAAGPNTALDPLNPKLWEMSFRLYYGYDDNVQMVPDVEVFGYTGTTDSTYAGMTAAGKYYFHYSPRFRAGVAGRIGFKKYDSTQDNPGPLNDNADVFSFKFFNPAIFAEYRHRLLARPAALGFVYDHNRVNGDDASVPTRTGTLKVYTTLDATPDLQLGASASFASINFVHDQLADPRSLRDADYTKFTLSARQRFHQGRMSLGLSYSWFENDAQGVNWDHDGQAIGVSFQSNIWGRLWGEAGYSYDWRDYKGFANTMIPLPAPGRTEQSVSAFTAKLLYGFNPWVTADVYYKFQKYGANLPQFEGDRSDIGAGVTLKY